MRQGKNSNSKGYNAFTVRHTTSGNLLTGSNDSSTSSPGLCASTTKRQEEAQPAQLELATAAVKVGSQRRGVLHLAQLAGVGRVADAEDGLEPAGAGGDGAAVYPDVEAEAAAVGAVAGLTDTAEGQGWDMKRGVVY